MSEQPKLVGIILCERILQDVLRPDAVSCVNVHNGISAQSFPALVPLIFAFAQIVGSNEGFSYVFKITDSNNTTIASSPTARVEPLPSQIMTHKVITAFSGLTFPQDGVYSVVLEVEGKELGSLPFQVVKINPEAIA